MSRLRFDLRVPPGFDFLRTVESHGWFDLDPFRWDAPSVTLQRAIALPGGRAAAVRLRGRRRRIEIELQARTSIRDADRREAARQTRWMLRLDEDLDPFYRITERVRRPDLRWVRDAGVGRLLRAPTVYEDLVRMICTTNCSWSLTRTMIGRIVARLGRPAPSGLRTFPTPEAMAAVGPRFYRDVARAGYRAGALSEVARRVDRGDLDPEAWAEPGAATEELRRAILSVKGAGPYVADNLLKLLGRYDGLGLDSWCRGAFSRLNAGGRRVSDRRIQRHYAPFGRWRGLALWCDLTRDWAGLGGSTIAEKFAGLEARSR